MGAARGGCVTDVGAVGGFSGHRIAFFYVRKIFSLFQKRGKLQLIFRQNGIHVDLGRKSDSGAGTVPRISPRRGWIGQCASVRGCPGVRRRNILQRLRRHVDRYGNSAPLARAAGRLDAATSNDDSCPAVMEWADAGIARPEEESFDFSWSPATATGTTKMLALDHEIRALDCWEPPDMTHPTGHPNPGPYLKDSWYPRCFVASQSRYFIDVSISSNSYDSMVYKFKNYDYLDL